MIARLFARIVFVRLPDGPSIERADAYMTAAIRYACIAVFAQSVAVIAYIVDLFA